MSVELVKDKNLIYKFLIHLRGKNQSYIVITYAAEDELYSLIQL